MHFFWSRIFLMVCCLVFDWSTHYGQKSDLADSYIKQQNLLFSALFNNPDSVRTETRNRIYAADNIPDSLIAGDWNIVAISYAIQGLSDSATLYFGKAVSLLNDNNHQKPGFMVNKASVLRSSNRIVEAMEILLEAERIAKIQKNNRSLSKVYGEMASCYGLVRNQEMAISYLVSSINLLSESDTSVLGTRNVEKQKLANYYLAEEKWEEALFILEEIIPYFRRKGPQLRDKYFLSLLSYAESLIQLNKLDEAEEVLSELIPGLEDLQNPYWLSLAEIKRARLFAKKGDAREAERWFMLATERSLGRPAHFTLSVCIEHLRFLRDVGRIGDALVLVKEIKEKSAAEKAPDWDKAIYSSLLAEIYAASGDYSGAYKLLNEGIKLRDSINESYNRINALSIQAGYENHLLQKEKESLYKELAIKNKNIIIGGLLLFVALLGIFYGIVLYRTRMRLKIKELAEAQLESQKYKDRLEYEKEISAKKAEIIGMQKNEIVNNAMQIAGLNEELEKFKEKFSGLSGAAEAEIKKFNPGRGSLQVLFDKIRLSNPVFFEMMKERYPVLTKSDIEFCAFVELGLSYKDIASILQISHESAISRKYRICKKLKIEGNIDFRSWLQEAISLNS
jgi:tetratricopeptide (TPR) repeat protein